MSYFEFFYNVEGVKTLRAYTRPLNLASLDRLQWMTSDAALPAIFQRLDALKPIPLLTEDMITSLSPVDGRSYAAGLLGADEAGLYQPAGPPQAGARMSGERNELHRDEG